MDPISMATIIGGGAQLVGSVVGQLFNSGRQEEAQQLLQQAEAKYGHIQVPGFESPKDQTLGATALNNVQVDPRVKQAQYSALNQIQGLAASGGMSPIDRANFANTENELARSGSATRAAVINNMRSRGLGGSGLELAAQLQGGQQEADQANKLGTSAMADAQRRALDAMVHGGQMSGQMNAQDFSQQSQIAKARDAIAQYNAEARERGAAYRNAVLQQGFGDQMSVANAQAGQLDKLAGLDMGVGQQQAQTAAGIGNGLGYGAVSYGMYQNNKPAAPAAGAQYPDISSAPQPLPSDPYAAKKPTYDDYYSNMPG